MFQSLSGTPSPQVVFCLPWAVITARRWLVGQNCTVKSCFSFPGELVLGWHTPWLYNATCQRTELHPRKIISYQCDQYTASTQLWPRRGLTIPRGNWSWHPTVPAIVMRMIWSGWGKDVIRPEKGTKGTLKVSPLRSRANISYKL